MRTCVIYSGQARSFAQVYRNQYFHVLRKLPNPEFFVSVADDEQAADMHLLETLFPPESVHIEYVKQPKLPEPPDDPPFHNIYPRDKATIQDVLRQLWALERAWEFFQETSKDLLQAFDVVVRIRPDIAFGRFEFPMFDDVGWTGANANQCYTPYWARWGGVNDRLAVMGWNAAMHYFTAYQEVRDLRALGCPLHPEQLINAALELGGIHPMHTLAAEFITVRLDGSFVPMSITEIDKLEYARSR